MQNNMTMDHAPKRAHTWLILALVGGLLALAALAVWVNTSDDTMPGLGIESSSRDEMPAQNPQQPVPQPACSNTCDQEQDLSDMQFAQALTIKEITKNRNGVYVITFQELENVAIATVNEGPVENMTQGSIINLLYKNRNGTFITCYIRPSTSPIIPPFTPAGCAP